MKAISRFFRDKQFSHSLQGVQKNVQTQNHMCGLHFQDNFDFILLCGWSIFFQEKGLSHFPKQYCLSAIFALQIHIN